MYTNLKAEIKRNWDSIGSGYYVCPFADTDNYDCRHSYDIALGNVRTLKRMFNLPVVHRSEIPNDAPQAFIRTDWGSDDIAINEHYVVYVNPDVIDNKLAESLSSLFDYPCLDDEEATEVKDELFVQGLDTIVDEMCKEGGFLFLHEWFRLTYWAEHERNCQQAIDAGLDLPKMSRWTEEIFELCGGHYDWHNNPVYQWLEDCDVTKDGLEPRILCDERKQRILAAMRSKIKAPIVQKNYERHRKWQENWHTLPGVRI